MSFFFFSTHISRQCKWPLYFVEECLQVRWVPPRCDGKPHQSCEMIKSVNFYQWIENLVTLLPTFCIIPKKTGSTYLPMQGQCAERTTPSLCMIIQPLYVGFFPNGVFSRSVGFFLSSCLLNSNTNLPRKSSGHLKNRCSSQNGDLKDSGSHHRLSQTLRLQLLWAIHGQMSVLNRFRSLFPSAQPVRLFLVADRYPSSLQGIFKFWNPPISDLLFLFR